ncbi:MAG: transposase [Chloroflexi bacterium]|nr:MAG: transposase [Chloroflexota bacterium]
MDVGPYLVEAHLREGRSVAELARVHGVHRSWLYKLLGRYRTEGEAGLAPRSRRPHRSPTALQPEVTQEIVHLRADLLAQGLDAGALTIQWHLERRLGRAPSVSSIVRVLRRRGLVVPQPHKRPRSSLHRFAAALPNQLWQIDATHWSLAGERSVEILNMIDDHSRLVVAAVPFDTVKIVCKHAAPYHPQTCGKVERLHQTLKRWLAKQPAAATLDELAAQLNRFRLHYNVHRPHRALGRRTPQEVFDAKVKAGPGSALPAVHYRVRYDTVDRNGKVTLRYDSRLHHIGLGARHRGKAIVLFVADRVVRIVDADGELLRELILDPTRDYQRQSA